MPRGAYSPPNSGDKTKGKKMSKPMTKTQLVAALSDAMGADKKTAGAALDAIAAIVAREVAAGGAVTLPGLGKVVCRARPERQVRNPATGETVTKPADKQVKFTIAKALKDSVNA
ncbi:UNVERIFIED_CONTAM: hupA [Trichonephila clavipes]